MSSSNLVITIGGPPGAGSTSVAKTVAEKFSLKYISTGSLFRKIAQERGLEVEKLSESAEKEVDLEVDNMSKQEAEKGNVVFESKLAAWMLKEKADVKIWLIASLETRANRIFNDEKKRVAEGKESVEAVKAEIENRFEEDKKRYLEYYQVDLDDMSIYDLVLDTENLSEEQVINNISSYIQQRIGG